MTNIAEILKNAPKGLKLYSLVHGEVTYDVTDEYPGEDYNISVSTKSNDWETFTKYGEMYCNFDDAECVLFPSKEHKSWENWQEVLFQCGDVIVSKNETPVGFQVFLCYEKDDRGYLAYGIGGGKNYITPSYYRYSTPEERDQFFKELNNNGYYWNGDTKQMEKALQQDKHKDCLGGVYTIKPFDKVLVKNYGNNKWVIDLFGYYDYDDKAYFVAGGARRQYCIPYNDETKHLLGTTDDCPKKYKTW